MDGTVVGASYGSLDIAVLHPRKKAFGDENVVNPGAIVGVAR